MLNRRYLRVKVLQALYAYFISEEKDVAAGEKEMIQSTAKIYDLYISLLLLFNEIADVARGYIEDSKNKMLPSFDDLNPNTRFVDNYLLKQLSINKHLLREANARKISWQNDTELVKKVFFMVRSTREYHEYMRYSEPSYQGDKELIITLFKRYISFFEVLESYYEEKSIYWVDDFGLVSSTIIKTLEGFNENSGEDTSLLYLYKDEAEDKQFIVDLYRKVILHDAENLEYISAKTRNWDVDRIAMMDVLLMKMAITELIHFPTIPVKVTLNEYIEISKYYSTPKSKIFINGILDKLVQEFRLDGKIAKAGRGLIE